METRTLAKEIVVIAAEAEDANLKVTNWILNSKLDGDITKADEAAKEAATYELGTNLLEYGVLAEIITDYTGGYEDGKAVIAYIEYNYTELKPEQIVELVLEDSYDGLHLVTIMEEASNYLVGSFNSGADFAEYQIGDFEEIPDSIVRHINWDEVWENELKHDYYESDGYYFLNW